MSFANLACAAYEQERLLSESMTALLGNATPVPLLSHAVGPEGSYLRDKHPIWPCV